MTDYPPHLQQQHELLELQAQIVRLKLKALTAQASKPPRDTPSDSHIRGLRLLLESIPLSSLAIKAVTHPKRWRNKLLLGAAVAGLAWLNKR